MGRLARWLILAGVLVPVAGAVYLAFAMLFGDPDLVGRAAHGICPLSGCVGFFLAAMGWLLARFRS
jgi:hypothetical protein